MLSSPGSRNGGWIESGRERRKRQQKGWSRSCSEVVFPEAVAPASGTAVSLGSVDGAAGVRAEPSLVPLCPCRHGALRRGCPAAARADRPAQEEHEQGPAREEIADAADASGPWCCVPASNHVTGPTADRWGGERAGCAGLQGAKEAAAAGGSVTTAAPFTPPRFQKEGRDVSVTAQLGPPHLGQGGRVDGL